MHPIKLKIELQHAPVKIVRKVLVPDNLNMWQVHLVIQLSMGWQNAHLFEFKDKMRNPEISIAIEHHEEFNFGFTPRPAIKLNPDKADLRKIFVETNKSSPFFYWYDFGDDWMHKISFLKVSKKDLADYNGVPTCLEASGACPPEDCGGVWGYAHLLKALADKKYPDHNDLKEWLSITQGGSFDPDFVDIETMNKHLETLMFSEDWNDCPKDIY